jgi:hypothetical protein
MCQKLQGVAEVLICMIGSLHDFVANWVTEKRRRRVSERRCVFGVNHVALICDCKVARVFSHGMVLLCDQPVSLPFLCSNSKRRPRLMESLGYAPENASPRAEILFSIPIKEAARIRVLKFHSPSSYMKGR